MSWRLLVFFAKKIGGTAKVPHIFSAKKVTFLCVISGKVLMSCKLTTLLVLNN